MGKSTVQIIQKVGVSAEAVFIGGKKVKTGEMGIFEKERKYDFFWLMWSR